MQGLPAQAPSSRVHLPPPLPLPQSSVRSRQQVIWHNEQRQPDISCHFVGFTKFMKQLGLLFACQRPLTHLRTSGLYVAIRKAPPPKLTVADKHRFSGPTPSKAHSKASSHLNPFFRRAIAASFPLTKILFTKPRSPNSLLSEKKKTIWATQSLWRQPHRVGRGRGMQGLRSMLLGLAVRQEYTTAGQTVRRRSRA